MHQPLNIPLGAPVTTRRDSGRVVALASGIVVGAFLGVLTFRVPLTLSATLGIAPADAAVVRLLKTQSTKSHIDAHIGKQAAFPGSPWSISALFDASVKEMTIALLPDGEMAYVLDGEASQEFQATATAFGMAVRIENGTTMVSASNLTPGGDTLRIRPRALWPWHKGEIIDGERQGSLGMSTRGLTLRGVGFTTEAAHNRIPEGATAIGQLTATTGETAIPSTLTALMSAPFGGVMDLLQAFGGSLLLTSDMTNNGYILTTSPGNLTSEGLASIGKDIMNRSLLSTLEWTLDDGTMYREIVSVNDDVVVEVRAEEDFTYVSLRNTAGSVIRMTKTADLLTIANREIDVSRGAIAKSACLPRAHSWLTSAVMDQERLPTTRATNAIAMFTHMFKEIAVSNGKIRLCW